MNAAAVRKRILFVDDEPSIRLTLPPVLEEAGFEVQVAETVSDAMFEINSNAFDVLISDLNIGEEGDGFLVTGSMRKAQPNCVTFILTGYPAFETALRAIQTRVDDYLVKPVEVETLIRTVREKLAQRQNSPIEHQLSSLLKQLSSNLVTKKPRNQVEPSQFDEASQQFIPSLVEALEKRSSTVDSETLQRAIEFGRRRKRQGVSAEMLAQEFESIQQGVYGLVMENLSRMDKQQLIADLPRFHTALSKLLAKSMEGLCGRIVRGKRSA